MTMQDFSEEQKQYLSGFAAGAGLAELVRGTEGAPEAAAPERSAASASPGRAAQDRVLAAGGTLSREEQAKREVEALDLGPSMEEHAREGRFPKGTDLFLWKFHGLFHVAPAQDAYMCRLRFAGGLVDAHQLAGIARLAEEHAGGYAHVTTRANLQLREIPASDGVAVLDGLVDLGVINRGAGGDNVRNITASPTAGIDPLELIDTAPLARAMHHHILRRRELYGLPRKFNIAFDGGGRVSAVADTNDVSFSAVELVEPSAGLAPGVYFRLGLGGITGHGDFARDTGLLLAPERCVAVADAVLRIFLEHADRTDRKRARLKYLLDDWGHERFVDELVSRLGADAPARVPLAACSLPAAPDPLAHVGVHPQRQSGLSWVGVVLPVGRLEAPQMRALAELARAEGDGRIRLTVWQNLLLGGVPEHRVPAVQEALLAMGLDWRTSNLRSSLVACTGNTGCKFAASDTKRHALEVADQVDGRVRLDRPVNLHLTGCPHSCAQHAIADIGMLGTKLPRGDDMVEGYHVLVGGAFGEGAAIGRELWRDVPADELGARVASLLETYLDRRRDPDESFRAFADRLGVERLASLTAGRAAEEEVA